MLEVPVFPDRDDSPTFPLVYTRCEPGGGKPALVILPGGPGFASVIRTKPSEEGVSASFEVVMDEHRGVDLSWWRIDLKTSFFSCSAVVHKLG